MTKTQLQKSVSKISNIAALREALNRSSAAVSLALNGPQQYRCCEGEIYKSVDDAYRAWDGLMTRLSQVRGAVPMSFGRWLYEPADESLDANFKRLKATAEGGA